MMIANLNPTMSVKAPACMRRSSAYLLIPRDEFTQVFRRWLAPAANISLVRLDLVERFGCAVRH
jgi:hypothetical protein